MSTVSRGSTVLWFNCFTRNSVNNTDPTICLFMPGVDQAVVSYGTVY